MFKDIIKGMPNGAEALQENFQALGKAMTGVSEDGALKVSGIDTDKLVLNGAEFTTEPKDLTPYLTKEFESAGVPLTYLVMGKTVHISGAVQAKDMIDATKQPNGGMIPVYTNLPFELAPGQMFTHQGSGTNQFAFASSGTTLSIHKHQKGGTYVPIPKGGYLQSASVFVLK